jgi:pimeloyl-ACP methyl ester carboxylesterase
VAADLRGHGLSDAPTTGYDLGTLVQDLLAVAEGAGLTRLGRITIAGHGFGAIVAAAAAATLRDQVGGLVLVDGGWDDVGRTTGLEPEEFLRGLEEPPEVLRSMDAFLADRRDFDAATWDSDQEEAARATVVEAHSKRLNLATRPHVVAACVATMFGYDPLAVLPSVEAPIAVLQAADDEERTHTSALHEATAAIVGAGRRAPRVVRFPDAGHNLMRYRPDDVSGAILAVAERGATLSA